MKLVTFVSQGAFRLGAILDGQVVDLPEAGKAFGVGNIPNDMVLLLQNSNWPALVQSVLNRVASAPEKAAFVHSLPEVQLAQPVVNPSKIVCVGLNYHDHCREQGIEVPKSPLLFAKFPSSIIGPDAEISWPEHVTQQVDYEAELAVVIGRKGRFIPPEQAYEYVAGYTIVNDVSARDVQFSDGQWVRGKSFDTFCPMGPYLLTADEVPDPHNLAIRCRVNGELRQDSNTGEMIFKIPDLIAFISQTCTLLPGDIINTGTPDGVGVFMNPKVFLKPGDKIEIEIEKLGRLHNTVK